MKTPHHSALALTFFAAMATTSLSANTIASAPPRTEQFGRDELSAQLDRNLAAGKRILSTARHQAKRLRGDARQRFEAAAADVEAAEGRLRESLKDVRGASVDEWLEVRLTLATDYEAYFRAIAEVQRIVSITTDGESGFFNRHRRAQVERDR